MAEPPTPLSRAHHAPRGRQMRTVSGSPTRQPGTDDLLSTLTPRTAVDAFRNPAGSLKQCFDSSTPTEQAFALRAAIASANIQEWLEEVSSWPWPAGGGPAGFEVHRVKQKPEDEPPPNVPAYGTLSATEVAKYERRVEEIARSMEELDVEEIKSQVLHNHIMPLSRPGSPMSDSHRTSTASLAAFAMMDDLTALITATLMQALPNLARLTKLLNIWSMRLLVLRRIPLYMTSLENGEVAVRSGWNAIGSSSKPPSHDGAANGSSSSSSSPPTLSRKEFDVMKTILQRKVAKAGRDLDAILDMLEGLEDTLPESWIDRMDALEQQYSEWTVACERKIREADWTRAVHEMAPTTTKVEDNKSKDEDFPEETRSGTPSLASTPPTPEEDGVSAQGSGSTGSGRPSVDDSTREAVEISETMTSFDASVGLGVEPGTPLIKVYSPEEPAVEAYRRETSANDDITFLGELHSEIPKTALDVYDGPRTAVVPANEKSPETDNDVAQGPTPADSFRSSIYDDDYDESVVIHRDDDSDLEDTAGADVPEPELPVLPRPRRGSDVSLPSTIVHDLPSDVLEFSSDQLEHGTPERSRAQDMDLDKISIHDLSSEGSPPDFRSSFRSASMSFMDMPTVAEVPDDESSPRTPLGSSFVVDDEPSRDMESPEKASTTTSDDHLQQQIFEILEGVPAKIRLTSEPAPINLNPPDFVMPTRKVPKTDHYPRSHSSLSMVSTVSSRAGTPSFTLAPAYQRNSRPRHQQRGNQDIKLYHLSRSNGEAPIKLFIRCVGEHSERVMVRVGGGWADLGEYLKEYASHHGRRSGQSKVEIKDLPGTGRAGSTPPTRPASAHDTYSPVTPLNVRKSRRSTAAEEATANVLAAQSRPLPVPAKRDPPSPSGSTRSVSSSRASWPDEDSELGMAGPKAKQIEMSEDTKAWVESVKEKVRIASGERKVSESSSSQLMASAKFGEIGKVGATKRLFRKQA